MVGSKILVIRLVSTVIVIMAVFFSAWYVFSRYQQLEKQTETVREEDINNPRLNRGVVDEFYSEYESRYDYKNDTPGDIQVEEKDPFYD